MGFHKRVSFVGYVGGIHRTDAIGVAVRVNTRFACENTADLIF